jgi:hypothetical protein
LALPRRLAVVFLVEYQDVLQNPAFFSFAETSWHKTLLRICATCELTGVKAKAICELHSRVSVTVTPWIHTKKAHRPQLRHYHHTSGTSSCGISKSDALTVGSGSALLFLCTFLGRLYRESSLLS